MKVGIQRLAICLALGSLCGCSGGQVAVKGEQDIGPIRALVRRGAWIHQAPTSQSPRARDALLSDRAYRVGRAFAVEVIGQKGPWVQARIQLRDAANHPSCVRSLWAFRGLGVQVYIHAKDLVPALTRTLRIEHPDGTEATLVAGTPVWPIAGTERYRIRTRRFRFHARVPEDALGLTWRYSGHFEPDESSQTLRPDHRAALLGTRDLVNTLRWTPTYVLDQRSVKAGQLLMVGDRCSRLALVGSSSDLASRRVSPGAGGQAVSMALMRRAKGPAMQLEPGTPLTWLSGRPAGRVDRRVRVDVKVLGQSEDGRVCWPVWIRALRSNAQLRRQDAALTLCVPARPMSRP